MKRNKLVKLEDCPIGLFIKDDTLCVKTEYGNDAYIVYSGEYFWGGAETKDERDEVMELEIVNVSLSHDVTNWCCALVTFKRQPQIYKTHEQT